jgi:hypothetical protein
MISVEAGSTVLLKQRLVGGLCPTTDARHRSEGNA